jgi:hypothetical protein
MPRTHFSLAFDVGNGAGRPLLLLRWRLGPARFGSYDDTTVQAGCHAPASEAVTAVTGYSSSTHHFLDDGRSVK